MNALQTWLIVGVPAIVLAMGLFSGRSRWRSLAGFAVIAATFLTFLLVAGDRISAAVVGGVGVLLLAVGRGGPVEEEPNHHETRGRFTHVAS